MVEPAKPFACNIPDCGMTFTNEDHLNVHTKKHDMVLQLGLELKSALVADQTPTPTRIIRCGEDLGLFQDLQNVPNPFDWTFKRAMAESKQGMISLDDTMTQSDDVLHTPQVFPLVDGDSTLCTNTQRNIEISRSSSDESGIIKEFETRTISKLTNEVTTVSRILNTNQTDGITIKHTDIHKDIETVSYKNNVITIASNIVNKDAHALKEPVTRIETKNVTKDAIDTNKLEVEKIPIMSQKSIDFVVDSLTSELVKNDHQTFEINVANNATNKQNTANYKSPQVKISKLIKNARTRRIASQPRILKKPAQNFEENGKIEVVVRLPNGKQLKMRPVEESKEFNTKEIIRSRLTNKVAQKLPIAVENKTNTDQMVIIKPTGMPTVHNTVTLATGKLIPVTLVDHEGTPLSNADLTKVAITKINHVEEIANLKSPKSLVSVPKNITSPNKIVVVSQTNEAITPKFVITQADQSPKLKQDGPKSCDPLDKKGYFGQDVEEIDSNLGDEGRKSTDIFQDDVRDVFSKNADGKRARIELESRCAASKRYRERLKEGRERQSEENRRLREANQKLIAEKAVLKLIITQHMKECSNTRDLINRLNVLRNCD